MAVKAIFLALYTVSPNDAIASTTSRVQKIMNQHLDMDVNRRAKIELSPFYQRCSIDRACVLCFPLDLLFKE